LLHIIYTRPTGASINNSVYSFVEDPHQSGLMKPSLIYCLTISLAAFLIGHNEGLNEAIIDILSDYFSCCFPHRSLYFSTTVEVTVFTKFRQNPRDDLYGHSCPSVKRKGKKEKRREKNAHHKPMARVVSSSCAIAPCPGGLLAPPGVSSAPDLWLYSL